MAAFTADEDLTIRQLLGYPFTFRYANPRLDSAIDLAASNVAAHARALSIIAEVATLEQELKDARANAGIAAVDEIQFFQGRRGNGIAGIDGLRSAGRQLSSRLSQMMGVPLAGDYWGERGYSGDGFMGAPTQYGNDGIFKLG